MKRNPQFKIGDRVTVMKLPPNLHGGGGMGTRGFFGRHSVRRFALKGSMITATLSLWWLSANRHRPLTSQTPFGLSLSL